ncbi:lysylphosphatidylglycerol synthase transmembrane domain-containing protein [Halarcobacter ebronensis]|uniref:lysylphosphatidylglycerol synthase transmembrane domain-containing protein n=1 Tax=Halarcobacter ebronensis TaxID=1462615 RepID=UPI0013E91B9C|nr:lysylphosphatidylglycerol synthase transmembrane domain-containing protein [Halarcobacter ebronensis]
MVKKILVTFIKFLIAFGLLYWLFDSGKLDFSLILNLSPLYIIICFFVSLITIFFVSIRLKILLKGQNIISNNFYLFKISLIGLFYSTFLPGGISGDVIKSYYLLKYKKGDITKTPIFLTVIIDRLVGFHALVFLGFISNIIALFLVTDQLKHFLNLSFWIFLTINICFLLLFNTKLFYTIFNFFKSKNISILVKLFMALEVFIKNRIVYVKSFFISIVTQILSICIIFLLMKSARIDIDYIYTTIISVYTFIINIAPISPGGLGVGEIAFDNMLSIFTKQHNGASIFLAARIFYYIPSLIGIYYFIAMKR